ncbi:hypothetical protein KBA73_03760 [Patescibacteria group bacterium]|nr:hypothetical protein [Patescibacteria group bacterium]
MLEIARRKETKKAGSPEFSAELIAQLKNFEKERKYDQHAAKEAHRASDTQREQLGIAEKFQRIRFGITALEAPTEPDAEGFRKELQAITQRLQANKQALFTNWVQAELAKPDSLVTHECIKWTRAHEITAQMKQMKESFGAENLLKTLKGMRADSFVTARVDDLRKKLESPTENTVATNSEGLFQQFLLDEAERLAANPGFVKKLFGKPTAKSEFESCLNGYTTPEWSMGKSAENRGISNKDILKAALNKRFDASGNLKKQTVPTESPVDEEGLNSKLKDIRRIIDGNPEAFVQKHKHIPPVGLEEFVKASRVSPEVVKILDAFSPILANPEISGKPTQFHAAMDEDIQESIGEYSSKTRRMNLYIPKVYRDKNVRIGSEEVAMTITHESAHAMGLEENLPLEEAIDFTLRLRAILEIDGPTTSYSRAAKAVYSHTTGGPSKLAEAQVYMTKHGLTHELYSSVHAVLDGDLFEEWAEMVNMVVSVEQTDVIEPKKVELVKDLFAKFGMSLEAVRATFNSVLKREHLEGCINMALLGRPAKAVAFVQTGIESGTV